MKLPPEPVVIRPALPEEFGLVHGLLADMANAMGMGDKFRSDAQSLRCYGCGDRPKFSVLLAETSAPSAVGLVVWFFEYSTWNGYPGVYVQDLYVAPEARGTGLGRRLLGAAALEGIREGARYMKLAVHDGNDAEKFYRRLGYVPSSDETVFALNGEAFQSLAAAP